MNYFLLRFRCVELVATFLGASVMATADPTAPPVEVSIHQLLDSRDQLESVLFGDVVHAVSGHPVLAVDPADPVDVAMLDAIAEALASSLKQFADAEHPIHQIGRVNEISRLVEDSMQEELDSIEGYLCEVPVNASGNRQRSGYPDLRFVHVESGRVFYLDPKVYRKGSETSSFRTFYFEPRATTNKILEPGSHLIIGVAHSGRVEGSWQLDDWQIVDLIDFRVRLKAEFQASNRDLYKEEAVLRRME